MDECSVGTDSCNQNCVNTDGSYLCYCNHGYHLMSDQRTCAGTIEWYSYLLMSLLLDTNECILNNGGCSQICVNTIGSYNCSCNTGYESIGQDCDGNYDLWSNYHLIIFRH